MDTPSCPAPLLDHGAYPVRPSYYSIRLIPKSILATTRIYRHGTIPLSQRLRSVIATEGRKAAQISARTELRIT